MSDKSCYTCHYHSIVDGKWACTYNGICHSPQGKKTAYRPMRGSLEEMEMAVMPFKMKKAYRSDYPRNTKWTRKVANYIRRMSMTQHDAEIVVTKEQRDRLSDVLNIEMEIRRAKEVTDGRKAGMRINEGDGLSQWCMNGRFPCDCAACNCPDKHNVEVTTSTSTTWVDNKSVKSE